jgi:hypothetical protein
MILLMDITSNLDKLGQVEQELLNSLTGATPEKQTRINERIANVQALRTGLYATISNQNELYNKSLENSNITLNEQDAAVNIIKKGLADSAHQTDVIQGTKIGIVRSAEINSYYSDYYEEKTRLAIIVFLTLLPIVALMYLKRFVPQTIYTALVLIIVFIGSLFGIQTIASLFMRDNMNYQEYDWYFNKANAPKQNETRSSVDSTNWRDFIPGTCVGEQCCSVGQTYDNTAYKCK